MARAFSTYSYLISCGDRRTLASVHLLLEQNRPGNVGNESATVKNNSITFPTRGQEEETRVTPFDCISDSSSGFARFSSSSSSVFQNSGLARRKRTYSREYARASVSVANLAFF